MSCNKIISLINPYLEQIQSVLDQEGFDSKGSNISHHNESEGYLHILLDIRVDVGDKVEK